MDSYFPPGGFFFKVTIHLDQTAPVDASFREVGGISMEMELEDLPFGGENNFHYRVPKGMKYSNLTLKRGLVVLRSPFAQWCFDTLQGHLAKPIEPKTVTVRLMDPQDAKKSLATWKFFNAFPVKWDISGLDAMNSGIVTESIEMAFNYFEYSTS